MVESIEALESELRALVEAERERLHIPGVAIGVIHGDDEWYAGFGVTNVDAPSPVDDATWFQIGSNTKTFVATAVMREVEAGLIDLDAPVQAYLPDFNLERPEEAQRVTVRDLLTHTGGWEGDWLLMYPQGGRDTDALERVVEAMPRVPMRNEPGALFDYNNTGFSIAGRLLEVVRDQPFEELMRELLFDPIGMEHTGMTAEEAITHRTAVGHIVRNGAPEVAATWELHRSSFPAGAIACDIRDLLRWGRFQLDGCVTADGERLLSEGSVAAMRTPQASVGLDIESVGLAWMLGSTDGVDTVSHSGGTNGQISLHMVYPERDAAIGIVTNANTGGTLTRNVSRFLEARLLGLEHPVFEPIDAGDALDDYVGSYVREMARIEVSRSGDHLVAQLVSTERPADWEASPQAEPVAIGPLEDTDAFVLLDGGAAGTRCRFLRGDDGALEWLRWGARLHRRQ